MGDELMIFTILVLFENGFEDGAKLGTLIHEVPDGDKFDDPNQEGEARCKGDRVLYELFQRRDLDQIKHPIKKSSHYTSH